MLKYTETKGYYKTTNSHLAFWLPFAGNLDLSWMVVTIGARSLCGGHAWANKLRIKGIILGLCNGLA
jgi:hypothetical protein